MSTNIEGNNSSRAIAINLVNNPRDFFKDAVMRSLSGYKLSNSIVFSSVTKFIYRFNKIYSLIKNENKETENQFPYGMCNAYISNTFVDYNLLEKDCIKFVKDQKTEVLNYLKDLEKYLVKAVSKRTGETPESREITKNALDAEIVVLQKKIEDIQKKFPLSILSKINNEKYLLTSIGLEYEKDITTIKQKRLQYENQIKDYQKEIKALVQEIQIINASNISVTAIEDEHGEGLLKDTRENITKQEDFIKDSFLEISMVDYGLSNPEYFIYNYKNRRFGNSMFWATLMPKPFIDRDITYAGMSKNKKDISTLKIFFAKRKSFNEVNPEVFEEEVYYPNEPTYTVICHIKKNTSSPQYGVFYLTPEDSPYLTSLLNQEVLFKNKELDKPIEFYPVIPIRELNKDLVEYDPIDIKTTLGFACEELLRNLYINIYGITKAVNKIGKESLEIFCKDNSIMAFIKNRYDVYHAAVNKPSFIKNDSTFILLDYYENKSDKKNRNSVLHTTTNKIIQDVYLALGISVDNFDSASAKYLYELFYKLKSECKVTKEKFLAYIDHQNNESYKYLDAYNLENRVSIRNTHFETLLTFNYIEEEAESGKWEYWNPLYKDLTLGYSEIRIVSKPQTKVFQFVYQIWDTPSMTLHGNNSEYYTPWGGVEYDNNILEIYTQVSEYSYTKLSVHGLKITYNRRLNNLPEFKKYPEAAQGYYNEDIKDRKYKLDTDSTTYSLTYSKFYKDSQKAEVTNITPKENMDLGNFIIPMWYHDITEDSYYKKDTKYTVNDVNNVLQRSLNLLIFGTLQDNQKELFPVGVDYFAPIVHHKKLLLSCLDSFISKFNKFEKFNRYLTNTIDTEEDRDKEVYIDLFYQIATNPNVSAYCKIPPTWDKPNYMVGQNKVSSSVSSQLMNNKSTFYFETLSQENKIFGDIGLQWNFKF